MFTFVSQNGEIAIHNSLFKSMRTAKKDILRVLTTFVDKCGEPEAPPNVVAQSILPLLLEATPTSILGDYYRSMPPVSTYPSR